AGRAAADPRRRRIGSAVITEEAACACRRPLSFLPAFLPEAGPWPRRRCRTGPIAGPKARSTRKPAQTFAHSTRVDMRPAPHSGAQTPPVDLRKCAKSADVVVAHASHTGWLTK